MLAAYGFYGGATESCYPTWGERWEFCDDYSQRRECRLYYSELDGRLHLKGASWGHHPPFFQARPRKDPLDDFGKWAFHYLEEGWFCLDCDFLRY